MRLARLVLWLATIGFIGFGIAFTFWPLPMASLIEIPLPTPTARIDFGATYGGFEIGFGIFLAACARRAEWIEPGLWATAAALAGFAAIRLYGLVAVTGPATGPIFIGLALELTGLGAALFALLQHRRAEAS